MALAPTQSLVETPSRAFYRQAMEVLTRAQVNGSFFTHEGLDLALTGALERLEVVPVQQPVGQPLTEPSSADLPHPKSAIPIR